MDNKIGLAKKARFTSPSVALGWVASGAGLVGMVAAAAGDLPPNAVAQFQDVVGSRVEAATILGGDYGAAGGAYAFRGGNVADLSIAKLGGGGNIAERRPLGVGDIEWAPVLQGGLGHLQAQNQFTRGYLDGNRMLYNVLAVEAGGGARFYFGDHFSVAPTISGIYGHTENQFRALNDVGTLVKSAASGTFVDWHVDTWTVVPSTELKYEWHWRRAAFEISSLFEYFHTESFNSSSPVVSVSGNSQTWANKFDVEVPVGWKLFGHELEVGGYYSRTELFGAVSTALNENHINTANGRLVFDMLGKAWKLRWLGVGYSYFWGAHFSGWSVGADVRLQF